MIISLAGSFGVGKTTLTTLLAERLGFHCYDEIARALAKEWGLTPATIPAERLWEFQDALMLRQVRAEEKLDATHVDYISDPAPIVNMAYLVDAARTRLSLPAGYRSRYKERAAARMAYHSLIILLPPTIPLVDDGIRHTSELDRRRIHDTILDLINEFEWSACKGLKDRVYTVQSRTPEDRLVEVLAVMRSRELLPCA